MWTDLWSVNISVVIKCSQHCFFSHGFIGEVHLLGQVLQIQRVVDFTHCCVNALRKMLNVFKHSFIFNNTNKGSMGS